MDSGIYMITCKPSDKLPYHYVGQTIRIRSRFREHRSELRGNRHHNQKLQRCWSKYGEESFTFEVLETCAPERLDELEAEWLREMVGHKRVCNFSVTPGGAFMRGRKLSDEHKAKISESHKSRVHYSKMRPFTAEHLENLSKAKKGKLKSAETRAKMSARQVGEGNNRWGKCGAESKSAKPVESVCIKTGDATIFACATEAVALGFNKAKISMCCNGLRPRHKGRTWRFIPSSSA